MAYLIGVNLVYNIPCFSKISCREIGLIFVAVIMTGMGRLLGT